VKPIFISKPLSSSSLAIPHCWKQSRFSTSEVLGSLKRLKHKIPKKPAVLSVGFSKTQMQRKGSATAENS
jgi:hypothetical protein